MTASWKSAASLNSVCDSDSFSALTLSVCMYQQVKTITALTVAALAEASAPYGIESFDDVLEPLWKGIRLLRGKVLAAFLKVCFLVFRPSLGVDLMKACNSTNVHAVSLILGAGAEFPL